MGLTPAVHDDGVNYVSANLKRTKIDTYYNANSIVLDVGFTPDAGNFGCVVLFNANMHTAVMFPIAQGGGTPDVIFGSVTYTLSISGSVLTLTPSVKLWGASTVIWSAYNS